MIWHSKALEEFAKECSALDPSHQRRVFDVFGSIDHLLTTEPMLEGESRYFDTDCVLIRGPVVVAYQVDLRLKVVRIVKVNPTCSDLN